MSAQALVALTTIDTQARAKLLARTLIEEGLAACVSIIPKGTSIYRWQGNIHSDPEHLLIIKTTNDRWQTLQARLRDLHPYDCPELIAWPVEHGLPEYLDWVVAETR